MLKGENSSQFYVGLLVMTALVMAGCSDMGSATGPDTSKSTPPLGQDVSFRSQISPIFQQYGCNSCHGGSGGLIVQSVNQLLQGGLHGPSIIAGKADSSNLIKKLLPNPPYGDRMPQGGPYVPDSTLQTIKLWINQGAKNN